MDNQPRSWLICYDIADPRRLARVHKTVSEYAVPIQYSVYHLHGTRKQTDALIQKLRHIIENKEDDIRIYPLPSDPQIVTIGPANPSGILLIGKEIPDLRPTAAAASDHDGKQNDRS